MRWSKSWRCDPIGSAIADRHYNRQSPGALNFVPPGRCLVLLAPAREAATALWVTSYPFVEYTRHAWGGAWVNSLFRNEGAGLSSELIVEAVAATRFWCPEVPEQGMVTFVNTEAVKNKRNPGYCYKRAGFVLVGRTKYCGHLALQMKPEDMPAPRRWNGARQLEFDFS